MIYLLDTNIIIAILRNQPAHVQQRLIEVVEAGHSIATSSVVLFEIRFGIARSQRRRSNTEQLAAFLAGEVDIVNFEQSDAIIAGDVRATLSNIGRLIGPYDLLIAAQALRLGATVVTANVSEFSRVPDLLWEDWTKDP